MVASIVSPVSLTSAPRVATRQLRAGAAPARAPRAFMVRATAEERQVEATTSRREVAVKAFAALTAAAAVRPAPALALFGFGEDPVAAYTAQTTAVIEQVRYTLELPPNDENKAAAIEKTRNLTNSWVARYRRDKVITGKPSYGNVYSALNAVSGHYNNFGTKYPLPAKRKERVLSEFATAEIALSRGR